MIKRSAALVIGSLGLGLAVHAGAAQAFDVPLLGGLALQKGQGPDWLIAVAQFLSWFGDTERRVPMVLALAIWLVQRGRRAAGIVVMLVSLLAAIVSSVMKDAYGRARPDLVPHLDHVNNLSYPSGHASNAIAFFMLAALIVPRANRQLWMGAAIAVSLLIGLSRPLLGVHWPTDVIGGWLLGLAFALIGAMVVERFEGDRKWQGGQRASL
jgi:undecaprenyl-diphosphatase